MPATAKAWRDLIRAARRRTYSSLQFYMALKTIATPISEVEDAIYDSTLVPTIHPTDFDRALLVSARAIALCTLGTEVNSYAFSIVLEWSLVDRLHQWRNLGTAERNQPARGQIREQEMGVERAPGKNDGKAWLKLAVLRQDAAQYRDSERAYRRAIALLKSADRLDPGRCPRSHGNDVRGVRPVFQG